MTKAEIQSRYERLRDFVKSIAEDQMDTHDDDIREDDDCPASEDMCASHNENIETAREILQEMHVRFKKREIG